MEDGEILHNCKNFRWNRAKMTKKWPKMAEINLQVSHVKNDNILFFFCFSTFSFWYFTNPEFWQNLKKITLKTGSRKYAKEKVENKKMLTMLSFIICETSKLISSILGQFLAIFTLFHLKFLQLCKNFPITYFRDPQNIDRLGK